MSINLAMNTHHQLPVKSLCIDVTSLSNMIHRRRRSYEVGN